MHYPILFSKYRNKNRECLTKYWRKKMTQFSLPQKLSIKIFVVLTTILLIQQCYLEIIFNKDTMWIYSFSHLCEQGSTCIAFYPSMFKFICFTPLESSDTSVSLEYFINDILNIVYLKHDPCKSVFLSYNSIDFLQQICKHNTEVYWISAMWPHFTLLSQSRRR